MSEGPSVRQIRPPEPPLAEESILLRPLAPTDEDAIFEACQDPEVTRWTSVPSPYQREHASGFIDETIAAWQAGRDPTFAIVDRASSALAGCIGLVGRDGAYEIGYWLAPSARGRGVATAAVKLISEWAIRRLGVDRIGLLVYVGNDASARVAEKAGYRREGLLRRYADQRGQRRDVIVYSLIADDIAREAD